MRHWKTGLSVFAAIVASAAAVSAIHDNAGMTGNAARAATPPPAMAMPVPVTTVIRKAIPVYREYTARTEAIRSITIQPRISGYIQNQDMADGSDVHEGDLLYTIDPRDLQAALDQVKAQARRDKAALELRAIQSQSRRDAGRKRLPGQGYLRPARERIGPGRGSSGHGRGRHSNG